TPAAVIEKPKPPSAVPMWLGNGERNYYGSGPWKEGGLKVVWQIETGFMSGRLHKDPWGGTSWPGQPSIKDDRVYFPSADGNVYCVTKGGDLDCIDPADGKFIWKSRIGADSDSTPAVANGFVYTAAEDGVVRAYKADNGELAWTFATDGARLYAAGEHIGIWGSPIFANGKIYIGGSNHYLYCLTADKGE